MRGIWRALFFFGLWLLGLAIAGAAQADYDPSDDLMNLFGAHCDSYRGPLVSIASAQSGALKSVVSQIMNDKDCSGGVASALNQISSINLDQITLGAQTNADLQHLRDESHDIELALNEEKSKPTDQQDSGYITILETELGNDRLALLKEKSKPSQIQEQNRAQIFDQVQKAAGTLFDSLTNAPGCAKKYPGLGAQFGGQLVAASSFLAGGILAPVLLASGSVIEKYLNYMQQAPYRRNLQSLTNSRMKTALGCGLEGIASTYCQARDVERVIQANTTGQVGPSCPTQPNTADGVNLIGTDLPAFSSWISRVVAGSDAVDAYQSAAKKDARDLLTKSLKLGDDFGASVHKATSDLAKSGSNPTEIIEGLVQEMADFSGGYPSLTGPSFRDDPRCGSFIYFYTGGTEHACTAVNPGQYASCKLCLAAEPLHSGHVLNPPTIDQITTAYKKLLSEATNRAALGASSAVETNPATVLAKFSVDKVNDRTAEDFLKGTKTYLTYLLTQPPFSTPGRSQDLVLNLQKRVKCTFQTINKETVDADCFPLVPPSQRSPTPISATVATDIHADPVDNSPEAQDARAQADVTKISSLMSPSRDLFFISDSLYELVLADLEQRRKDPNHFNQDLSAILQLSASDSLGELLKSYGGPDALNAQALAAQDSTLDTLKVYGKLFADPLARSIHDLKSKNSPLLGLACAQALLDPDAPKIGCDDRGRGGVDITPDCKGSHWKSVYPGLSLDFDNLTSKPATERVCSVYDFYRRSKMEEMKKRRPSQPTRPISQPSSGP